MKVEVLYTLKDPRGGFVPKGIYSDKTLRGVPEVVMDELRAGARTVRLLSGKIPSKNAPGKKATPKDEGTTLQEPASGTTTKEPKPESPSEEPASEVETVSEGDAESDTETTEKASTKKSATRKSSKRSKQ